MFSILLTAPTTNMFFHWRWHSILAFLAFHLEKWFSKTALSRNILTKKVNIPPIRRLRLDVSTPNSLSWSLSRRLPQHYAADAVYPNRKLVIRAPYSRDVIRRLCHYDSSRGRKGDVFTIHPKDPYLEPRHKSDLFRARRGWMAYDCYRWWSINEIPLVYSV